jgi:hypothetical protein
VTYFQERPLTDADRAAVDAHVASRRDKLVTRVSEWLVADERERKETAKFLRDKLTSSDPKIRTPPWDTIDNLDRAWMSRRLQAWLMAWTIEQLGTKQELEDASIIVDREAFLAENKFREQFPPRLQSAGPRVLKQNRGNGGQGVWKVELVSASAGTDAIVRVLQARRGSVPEDLPLGDFMSQCEGYFAAEGCIVDQPFQPRLPDGMIRCYMGADKVVGFGHQLIKALIVPPPEGPDSPAALPGPRVMHPASAPAFQALRTKMESEWTPRMMQVLNIDAESLPIIWDADFLYGPRDAAGQDTYVLCEINVSSVFPIPEQAPSEIARIASARLLMSKKARR